MIHVDNFWQRLNIISNQFLFADKVLQLLLLTTIKQIKFEKEFDFYTYLIVIIEYFLYLFETEAP